MDTDDGDESAAEEKCSPPARHRRRRRSEINRAAGVAEVVTQLMMARARLQEAISGSPSPPVIGDGETTCTALPAAGDPVSDASSSDDNDGAFAL